MPWTTSVFPLLIVVSGPPFTGLFVYSPAPGPGNMVASITAAAGTDPYGNFYDAGIASYSGLNTAILNSSALTLFAGITERATLSTSHFTVFNSHGATIYDIDLSRAAQFLYADTGSATQGALIASQSQNSGTDQFGNAYQPGIVSYQAGTAFTQLISGSIGLRLTGATPSVISASIVVALDGAGQALELGSGLVGADSSTTMILGDSAAAHKGLQVIDGRDGNTYKTERVRQSTTATQQFTLASAVAITGLSIPLGVGTYHVRLKAYWQPSGVVASTHVHNFAFTGTATGNVNGQCWQAQAASGIQQGSLNAAGGNNLTASLTSPTHVAFPGWTDMEADITVTAAGTLTPTITLTTAGDDVTTSAGTYWEINPES